MFQNHALPMVHVLMSGRTAALYEAVFEKIISLVPDFSPEFWMGDFEAASRSAVHTWLYGAQVAGC